MNKVGQVLTRIPPVYKSASKTGGEKENKDREFFWRINDTQTKRVELTDFDAFIRPRALETEDERAMKSAVVVCESKTYVRIE